MKSETLITALVTAGTLFLTKIMLDDVILRTKKDELERRLENAMRNYEGDSRKLTEKEKDEVNKEYDSLCAKLVKSSYSSLFLNKKLEQEMDLAYTIVKLGRSARNSVNIKNRQPLSEMLISVNTLPEYYSDIVKEE